MSPQLGIIGLPNVGKSTLFNALMASSTAVVANYPFTTVQPNIGVVPVPDERLATIARLYRPRAVTPATLTVVDIAGLVQGASRGEGLGNTFLAEVRTVDALLHVVRCFDDPEVTHVAEGINPVRDVEIVETELALADLEVLTRRRHKIDKRARAGDAQSQKELMLLDRLAEPLNQRQPLRELAGSLDEAATQDLLTAKPLLYVANVSDEAAARPQIKALEALTAGHPARVLAINSRLEAELAGLTAEERARFRQDLGLPRSVLEQLIAAASALLGLITFFTVNDAELRAWTIRGGTTAVQAAGKIHSDMQRGFIRVKITRSADLVGLAAAPHPPLSMEWRGSRERGRERTEGRDYLVQDGDVLYIHFKA